MPGLEKVKIFKALLEEEEKSFTFLNKYLSEYIEVIFYSTPGKVYSMNRFF